MVATMMAQPTPGRSERICRCASITSVTVSGRGPSSRTEPPRT
jgi:hypothetical protein